MYTPLHMSQPPDGLILLQVEKSTEGLGNNYYTEGSALLWLHDRHHLGWKELSCYKRTAYHMILLIYHKPR